MRFEYCPSCGERLGEKNIGDEGLVPFCGNCRRPWFDFSYPCVICLCVNEEGEVLLIKQSYGQPRFVLVAGFIQVGESAENAALREVKEETGLCVNSLDFTFSSYYEPSDSLMFGFICRVKKSGFTLSSEVEQAKWVSPEEAVQKLRKGGTAHKLAEYYYSKGKLAYENEKKETP